MERVHSGQLLCPFCFICCDDYPSLRKHCETRHKEMKKEKEKNVSDGKKKPCRYFRNGEGVCSPRSGKCDYNHAIIPDEERELCFTNYLAPTNLTAYFITRKNKEMMNGKETEENLERFVVMLRMEGLVCVPSALSFITQQE